MVLHSTEFSQIFVFFLVTYYILILLYQFLHNITILNFHFTAQLRVYPICFTFITQSPRYSELLHIENTYCCH
jgi:hypothetical protein